MAQPLGRCPRQQIPCRQHENARSADRKENELKDDVRLNVVLNDVERGSETERSDRAEDIYDREIDREDAEILRRIEPGQHGDGSEHRELADDREGRDARRSANKAPYPASRRAGNRFRDHDEFPWHQKFNAEHDGARYRKRKRLAVCRS